jgi:hypothetical protein
MPGVIQFTRSPHDDRIAHWAPVLFGLGRDVSYDAEGF